LAVLVGIEPFDLAVAPEVIGIIRVSLALAYIAVKVIEALLVRISGCSGTPKTPFSKSPGGIASLF